MLYDCCFYDRRIEGLHAAWLLSLTVAGQRVYMMYGCCLYSGRIEGLHAAWLLSLQWQDRGSTCCMTVVSMIEG